MTMAKENVHLASKPCMRFRTDCVAWLTEHWLKRTK